MTTLPADVPTTLHRPSASALATGRTTALEPVRTGLADMRQRTAWARAFAGEVRASEAQLTATAELEMHKRAWETLTQEFMPLLAAVEWNARRAPRVLAPRRVPGSPWWALGQRHFAVRKPAGRVLIIATWNYPIQLLGIQMVQAVMAGNAVVVKPSERTPDTQRLLVECAQRAAMAVGGSAQLLQLAPASRNTGRELLERERFDHVVFTGSTEVGRQVAAACARTLTPCTLELSGRDSAIVLADAPMALAARSIWAAVAMNAGQTCMAPRRVLVERAGYERFLAEIRPLAAAARPVRLSSAAMAERCARLLRDAVHAGGAPASGVAEPAQGEWLRPQAVLGCPADHELAQGDHFGPVLAVTCVDSLGDAVELHRACEQHLATSVFTAQPGRVLNDAALMAALGSGVVTINDAVLPTGHPGAAMQGTGPSGWGASRGEAGLLELTRSMHVTTTSRWIRPPLDEPTPGVLQWMRRLVLGRARASSAAPRVDGDRSSNPVPTHAQSQGAPHS